MAVVPVPRVLVSAATAVLVGVATSACGLTIPTDPHGTLDEVRSSGVLRVGVSPNEPWTVVGAGEPTGTEPALVADYAASLGVDVEWEVNGETPLMDELEKGEVDVVIGGLTQSSPWVEHAALTRPYAETTPPAGQSEHHVMAVRLGENALLSDLERFLMSATDGGEK